jgi:hypothetical protein
VAPSVLHLLATSSCELSNGGNVYDATKPVVLEPAYIYGLSTIFETKVELQECTACSYTDRHWIGPDCRELGVFNYNNQLFFTHDLLDEYTNAYTTSETPFVAWVSVVARRYAIHQTVRPFISDDKFRAVWFAYTRLQDFRDDMKCPHCGPSPEDIIWDGVTLAFNKKHLRASLQPPTALHPLSAVRDGAQYDAHQQLLPDVALRRLIRLCLKGPKSGVDDLLDDSYVFDQESQGSAKSAAARAKAALEHIDHLSKAGELLAVVLPALGRVFVENFGVECYAKAYEIPKEVVNFFEQVCVIEP